MGPMLDLAARSRHHRRRAAAIVILALGAALEPAPARSQDAAPAAVPESARMPGVPFEELSRRAQEEWNAGPSHAEDALRFYRAGVALDPRWADGWWHVALVEFNLDRFGEARAALARLVALQPDSGPAWSLLGVCDFRLGSHDRAVDELLRGRSLGLDLGDSLGTEAARSLAFLLVRDGNFRPAGRELSRLVRTRGDDAELIAACGLYGLRRRALPGDVPVDERDLVRRVGQATAAALASRADEARALFQDALARYPRARGLHLLFGRFLMREASPGAGEAFRAEAALFPDNADALVEVALDALEHDRAAEGLSPAKKAVSLAPDAVWSRYALGRVLAATGSAGEAVAQLERADALKPEDPDVLLALAQAYGQAGRPGDVERVRAKLLTLPALREPHLVR